MLPHLSHLGDSRMLDALSSSFTLINPSGLAVLTAILALLIGGVAVTVIVRARYGSIAGDLRRSAYDGAVSFESSVLTRIVREALDARRATAEVNAQAIIESCFAHELRGLLIGERFVKASAGLTIIFGLVGTFFGLSLSIGKLVKLVASSDVGGTEQIADSLTAGLVDALAGMSVAFTSSLFGILAAIVMTLLGVFASISDKRQALVAQIESYLDHVVLTRGAAVSGAAGMDQMVGAFAHSVGQLEQVIGRFEGALGTFASNTRDFQEINLHLKDNIQRMSLSFADLSESLKRRDGR
jgi:methyl-accepting chemotaxis protein